MKKLLLLIENTLSTSLSNEVNKGKRKFLLWLKETAGLSDKIVVKIKPMRNRLKHALGCYRSMTAFRNGHPIFWIAEDLPEKMREEGIAIDRLGDVIADTIAHEYGHVVWEFVRDHQFDTPLGRKLESMYGEDEEEFAEDVARAFNGSEYGRIGVVDLLKLYAKEAFN